MTTPDDATLTVLLVWSAAKSLYFERRPDKMAYLVIWKAGVPDASLPFLLEGTVRWIGAFAADDLYFWATVDGKDWMYRRTREKQSTERMAAGLPGSSLTRIAVGDGEIPIVSLHDGVMGVKGFVWGDEVRAGRLTVKGNAVSFDGRACAHTLPTIERPARVWQWWARDMIAFVMQNEAAVLVTGTDTRMYALKKLPL